MACRTSSTSTAPPARRSAQPSTIWNSATVRRSAPPSNPVTRTRSALFSARTDGALPPLVSAWAGLVIGALYILPFLLFSATSGQITDKYEKKENVSMETVKLISMSKIVVGELVSEVMDMCLQFHGGWGYTEEFPIARAWRDSRLLRLGGGTTETMTYYLAKLMGL